MHAQSVVTENVSKYSSSLNQEVMVYNTWLTHGLLSSVKVRVYIIMFVLISMQAQSAVQEDIPKLKESTLKQEMMVWWF